MEKWAERIEIRLQELKAEGKSRPGLAKACAVKDSSVSGWFGRGTKPTKMISGDNLVAAARYLNTSAEWLMTGKDAPATHSHHERPDGQMLSSAVYLARRSVETTGSDDFNAEQDGDIVAQAYVYLQARGLSVVADSNVLEFTRALRVAEAGRDVVGREAGAGQAGGAGGGAGQEEERREAKSSSGRR